MTQKHLDSIIDTLIATPSQATAQRLLQNLVETYESIGLTTVTLIQRFKTILQVCTSPPGKAEYIGYAFVKFIINIQPSHWDISSVHNMLLDVFRANPQAIVGMLTMLERHDLLPFTRIRGVQLLSPVLIASLIDARENSNLRKLTILHSLHRIIRQVDLADETTVRATTATTLVRAVVLFPRVVFIHIDEFDNKLGTGYSIYPSIVASTVDLLVASPLLLHTHTSAVADAVLAHIERALTNGLPTLALLQSLLQLISSAPEPLVLLSSSFVLSCGALLIVEQCGLCEQALLLRILELLLRPSSSLGSDGSPRRVFVEMLIVPLVSMLPTHPNETPLLLQRVMSIVSTSSFHHVVDQSSVLCPPICPPSGPTHIHMSSFLALVASVDRTLGWVNSLFHDNDSLSTSDPLLFHIQLGALLVDYRGAIRNATLETLERQVVSKRSRMKSSTNNHNAWKPLFTKRLVSTMVFLISYKPHAESNGNLHGDWLCQALRVLAIVGSSTNETMRIVLKLIKQMATVTSLRSQAVHLLVLVWKQDSRVYPQLETMLVLDEQDGDDFAITRMASILSICHHNPEVGVEWISVIQSNLEDRRPSIVAMAIDAITTLCQQDYLEWEMATKSLWTKRKKQKIHCVDHALCREAFCRLYACGGPGAPDTSRTVYKVVEELWEWIETVTEVDVRVEAWKALNVYDLVVLDLSSDVQDEDSSADDKRSVVWTCLENESDTRAQSAIEHVVTRILSHECRTISPTARTMTQLFNDTRISRAATKVLQKLAPSRESLVSHSTDDSLVSLFLSQPQDDPSTRKDKHLRHVTNQVQNMVDIMHVTWARGKWPTDWYAISLWMSAWQTWMDKLWHQLKKLALLKTPSDGDSSYSARILNDLVQQQLEAMQTKVRESSVHVYMALGALTGVAAREDVPIAVAMQQTLRHELLQSVEALRVWNNASSNQDSSGLESLMVAMILAHTTKIDTEQCIAVSTVLITTLQASHHPPLVRSIALLCASHLSVCLVPKTIGSLSLSCSIDYTAAHTMLKKVVSVILKTLFVSVDVETVFSRQSSARSDLNTPLKMRSTSSPFDNKIQWVACMALAHIAHVLPYAESYTWLRNIENLLSRAWDLEPDKSILAVALGPIKLVCIKYHIITSDHVHSFVSTLYQRLHSSGHAASTAPALLVLPYMVSSMPFHGCTIESTLIEATTNLLLDLQSKLQFELTHETLVSLAISNMFHVKWGIDLLASYISQEQEILWEPALVEKLVTSLQTPPACQSSTRALAMVVDRVESWVVLQRNKTLDVELFSLIPRTTAPLLSRTLTYLHHHAESNAAEPSSLHFVESLVCCLSTTTWPLPLIDFTVLIQRLTARFGARSTRLINGAVELASIHPCCLDWLVQEALTTTQLNKRETMHTAMISINKASSRLVSSKQLYRVLGCVWTVLTRQWMGDRERLLAWMYQWIDLLAQLLTSPSDTFNDNENIRSWVLDEMMPLMPFTPHDAEDARVLVKLAEKVLSQCGIPVKDSSPDHGIVFDALLHLHTHSTSQFSWWQSGQLLMTLISYTRSSTSLSLVFRWLLQQNFEEWRVVPSIACEKMAVSIVQTIGSITARPIHDIRSYMMDLIDMMGQTQKKREEDEIQRRILWIIVTGIVGWTCSASHEQYLSTHDPDAALMASLLAFGLLPTHNHEIWDKLWSLRSKLIRSTSQHHDVVKIVEALETMGVQLYLEQVKLKHEMMSEVLLNLANQCQ